MESNPDLNKNVLAVGCFKIWKKNQERFPMGQICLTRLYAAEYNWETLGNRGKSREVGRTYALGLT
jgi:hypothetical protein